MRTYSYIYTYVCVCVVVSIYVWASSPLPIMLAAWSSCGQQGKMYSYIGVCMLHVVVAAGRKLPAKTRHIITRHEPALIRMPLLVTNLSTAHINTYSNLMKNRHKQSDGINEIMFLWNVLFLDYFHYISYTCIFLLWYVCNEKWTARTFFH